MRNTQKAKRIATHWKSQTVGAAPSRCKWGPVRQFDSEQSQFELMSELF